MKVQLFAALAGLALTAAVAPASATTLLDVTNQDGTTSYDFAVTATAADTGVFFAGYNLPSFIDVTNIAFYSDAAPSTNLLGASWTFKAAPSGSDAFTFSDGTSVPALAFGAVVVKSYDVYSQKVATTVGAGYQLVFQYSNGDDPSGLKVATGSVPEPASWALMIGGFGLVGTALRRRTAMLAA